jgi:hypothetical protein
MSNERDLLMRVKVLLKCVDTAPLQDQADLAIKEIQELLAQPEQDLEVLKKDWVNFGYEAGRKSALSKQEPVAWLHEGVDEIGEHVKSVVYNFYDDANLIPLYTAPPKREPLSDESICEILLKKEWRGFVDLVRIIEKAHGIGVYDE